MDAVTAVMNDHRVLEDLFEQLRADDEHRVVLLAEVTARLTAHSRAEERYIYRALPAETRATNRGAQEHADALAQLADLPSADDFPAALEKFVATVRAHVVEEEANILTTLRDSVSARKREELGRRFEETRIRELKRAGIDDTLTKEDLYIRAQRAGIAGRSGMTKGELIRALLATRK
jgi:hypothetical protein